MNQSGILLGPGNIVKAISNLYNPASTYAVGDYCTCDGYVWKCNTAISTAEEWTAAHWDKIKVTDEIATILENKVNTSAIKNNLTTTSSGYVLDARQGKALNDNLAGKVTGPESATDGTIPLYDGTSGKAIKAGKSITDVTSSTAIANNSNIPTNRTVLNGIYNGLDKTDAGFALDARQGRALDDKIDTQDIGTFSSLASLESALVTLNSNMNSYQFKNVKFATSTAFGKFGTTTYTGTVSRFSAARMHCEFHKSSGTVDGPVIGKYNDSWTWDKFGLDSNIETYGCEVVNFYPVTLGTAKSITAKSYARVGYAMGIFHSYSDSRFIIPFAVSIPKNSSSLTINEIIMAGSNELITSGTYDIVLYLFRAM